MNAPAAELIAPAGHADAGAFLVRLVRLDPAALVRVRPVRDAPGRAELWAILPFDVAVARPVPIVSAADRTVAAGELLRSLSDPGAGVARRDEAWRWPLPSGPGRELERIPERELARVAQAAGQTLRDAATHGVAGRAVGERILRDALLDHVAITVTGPGDERVDVPQRLVQAVVRMGFLQRETREYLTQGETLVTVRRANRWIGLVASYGSAWYLPRSSLLLS